MQAANTGLTGGSTPRSDGYDRPVVIISTLRIRGIQLLNEGRQVVCLPGATLDGLERRLAALGREPHSVIGSSCVGASVIGGICNNSGGALVRRGPAYTELSLYAQLNTNGTLELVNHLGIALPANPEEALEQLEAGRYTGVDVSSEPGRCGSDGRYGEHVRDVDAPTPARFNADPQRLFEASGSAGHLAVFAVRLDTFAAEAKTTTFYIGTDDPNVLTDLRRDMLQDFSELPVASEYIHCDASALAERYGKDTVLAIRFLGTSRIRQLFAAKAWVDRLVAAIPLGLGNASDHLLQAGSHLFPTQLPRRLRDFRRFKHHLVLKMAGRGVDEARNYLAQRVEGARGTWIECTADEGKRAFLHRFAVAGAAIRYRAVHPRRVGAIVAIDVALRRNDREWREQLPDALDRQVLQRLYYGHFFCHVFHQDYLLKRDVDASSFKREVLAGLEARGAAYPAEHNFGHLYSAGQVVEDFYKQLDPRNAFNPGTGQASPRRAWS